MKNIIQCLIIGVSQFIGSRIGGLWFFIFTPFPLFFILQFIPKKYEWRNVPFSLFPLALLLLDFIVFLPPRIKKGMTFKMYFYDFFEAFLMILFLACLQWGILKLLWLSQSLIVISIDRFFKNKEQR
ncbi:MAG: hypothetical protein WC958_06040 [Dehalococcoidales bacterium]